MSKPIQASRMRMASALVTFALAAAGLMLFLQNRNLQVQVGELEDRLGRISRVKETLEKEQADLDQAIRKFLAIGRERFGGSDAEVMDALAETVAGYFNAEVAAIQAREADEQRRIEEANRPKPNELAFSSSTMVNPDGGLIEIITFEPRNDQPLETLAVVVRIAEGFSGKILSLKPLEGGIQLAGASSRISDDGAFAVYQGNPDRIGTIQFELKVTGPTRVSLNGNLGIGSLELAIGNP